jgi:DNA-binding GntR family transcriptional regulator
MTITTADRQVVSVSEMQELFEAICTHDPERARAAAVEHVKQAAAVARRLLAG